MLGSTDKEPRGWVDELNNLHPLPAAAQPQQVAGPWQRFQPQAQQPATQQPTAPQTDWSKFVPDQPAAGPWQKYQQDLNQFVPDPAPEQPREMGIISTLAQGFRNTGRAVGAAADVAIDDRASVVERSNAQAAAPKNENLRAFEGEIESRRAALGTDDPGLLDALGVVGGAVLSQPKGAGYAVLEQAPNAVAALAPAWAGAKLGATAGAAIPLPGAAPVLGVAGGLAGLFLGNTALEVGNKAMEKATDGQFTAAEREAAFQEGGTKAATITGIDAATLGLSKWIMGATSRAVERATSRALTDAGVDVGNEVAVMTARRSPEMVKAVRQAQEAAIDVTATFGKKAARAGAALALETVGEGLGEYLGELAATGQANMVDAVLESVLSLGQSGAEVAWGASKNAAAMAAARLNPAAGPNSRAAIVALNQQAQGKLPPTEDPAAGTMQQAAAAGQLGGDSNNQVPADWAQQIDAALGTAPEQQESQPMVLPWLRYEQQAPATDLSGFVPDAAPAGFVPNTEQPTIEQSLGTAPTAPTSPAAPIDQQDQQQAPRLVPMKDETAAARRAEVVAKRTGIEQVVIPHPTVPERFAFVPVDSPLATSAAPTAQAEGLDVEGLFQTQAPIPLKNARNLAGLMSTAGGTEHAVVPAPSGDGFGVVPADQLSPAQRDAWAGFQPGARRGVARRAPGPVATPPATATPTTSASTTSSTATPIGTPDAGPELAQVAGLTPQAVPAAPAVPEGAQGFNTEAQRAAPALPQIDSNTFTSAIGSAQATIRRERWTIDGGRRFEGRVRAELERAGVPENAAQAVIDLAKQQAQPNAFVTGDALAQAARTLGVISTASTTTTPDTSIRPLDHGELNIPGRTNTIDAELDRWKADQTKQKRAQAKTDAATRREQKAEAKRLFSQFGPAMIERYTPRFGRKEIEHELDQMVKWQPAKFIELAQRFEREQAAAAAVPARSEQAQNESVPAAPETDPYASTETRPGTTEKQRAAGRSALRDLLGRLGNSLARRRNDGADRGTFSLLGARLYDGFVAGEANQLVGQEVSSPADLAALAQVYRDPRFETFRAFFVKNGRIVGENGYSSRLPAVVRVPDNIPEQIRDDMQAFGADGYYLLHNHPSGRSEPSVADLRLTNDVDQKAPGMLGHVVIDFNEYSVIQGGGQVQRVDAPELAAIDFKSKPELQHQLLNVEIGGPDDVVSIAKALQIPGGHATLVLTGSDGRVSLLLDLPAAMLDDSSPEARGRVKAVMRALARESGSGGHRFIVLPAGAQTNFAMGELIRFGVVSDVVTAGGDSMRLNGTPWGGDFLDGRDAKVMKVGEDESPYRLPRAQTDTATFRRWFGNSQAIDENGQPLVMYHGTNKDIEAFKAGRGGRAIWFAADPTLANMFVAGGRQRMAEGNRKGSAVYPVFLSVQKPLDLGDASPQDNSPYSYILKAAGLPANYDAVAEIARRNLETGYAGVSPSAQDPVATLTEQYMGRYNRLADVLDNPGLIEVLQEAGFDGIKMQEQGATTFAVFRPEQIKSATGNAGTFDPTDPSIVREDAADPYAAGLEIRPNTTPAQLDAGRAALADVQRRILSLRGQRMGAAVLGSRLAAELATTGGAQLIGQEVRDASDLAVLGQIYRDPRFETWRAFYLKDGRIVGENAFSSRLPGAVILPEGIAGRLKSEMAKYGADAVFTMHNHPRGSAMPSAGDLGMAVKLRRDVPGWQGEVIIDNSEYAVLTGLGLPPLEDFYDLGPRDLVEYGVKVTFAPRLASVDFNSAPELKHRLLGLPIGDPSDIAKMGKGLQVPDGHAAMIVTAAGKVQALLDVPVAPLQNTKTKLGRAATMAMARRITRATGGNARFLVVPKGVKLDPWLVRFGIFQDVVTETGISMLAGVRKRAGNPNLTPIDQIGANARRSARQLYEPQGPGYDAAEPGTRRNRAAEPQQTDSVEDFTPTRRNAADWARGAIAANRPWMLGALTRDQIVDIWGRDLPQIVDFDRTVQAMDADRASIAQAADEIVERWRKLPTRQSDALADIMHSATLAGFDPDTMNATQPEHDQILADWNALSDEAQAVYREARDTHRATLLAIRNGLADRAERTGSMGRQIADRIRLDFDKFLSHGVYFPLSRFGDLLLIADRDGERTVEAFESGAQREARARQLRADGWRVKMTSKSQYSAMRDGAAGAFTQEVMQHLEGLDIDPAQKSQLFDTLNQLAISMLPDASYRRHFKHRKGTPGFSRDAMRGFAQAQQHAAHHIARIRHADRLVTALDELQAEIQGTAEGDVTEWQHVANELTRRLEQILNPNTHPVAAAAGQVGFVMSLGGSIASGLVNLSQTPLVFYPWAGSRFGFDKAAAALTKATRDYLNGKWDRWSGFVLSENPNIAPEERDALKRLEASGIINLTLAHDLAGAANADSTVSRSAFALNRAMKVISWTFHLPETYNRQVSALTAYRLAREAGQTHEEAIETARDGIVRSHFDYSASNRARYMHGNFIRVVTMFKQYSQQMTYMLWRNAYLALRGESAEVKSEARRMLFGVMSMHFGVAGSLGLPLGVFGISPLLSLLAMGTGDEDDPPLDWQDEYRLWLADTFGHETGEAIAKGPVRLLLDVDLASRVGLGDLWVRAPLKEKEGRDAVEQWMLTLLGPIAGYAGQMGTAMQAFEEGQPMRGVEAMMPKFISSAIKAVRYETEGVRSWRGDDLGVTLSNADIIGTAMGFQPTALSEMYSARSVVKGREAKLQRRREDLMRAWREARDAGDSTGLADVITNIRRFNDKNRPFAIGPQHLKASWMAHRRAQLQTAQGINLSRRRDELREYGRFANID